MENFTKDWGIMRVARLLIGAYIVWDAFKQQTPVWALLGAFFIYQAVMNTGCAMGGCNIQPKEEKPSAKVESVDFEEIK